MDISVFDVILMILLHVMRALASLVVVFQGDFLVEWGSDFDIVGDVLDFVGI